MTDKAWKAFERRLAADVGTSRIPVTGERQGADWRQPSLFAYQGKLRRSLPAWPFRWLAGIVASARTHDQIGVLVVKRPRQKDAEALVILRWQDWCDLHGRPEPWEPPLP